MAAPPTSLEVANHHLITTSDLEIHTAHIADPNIGVFFVPS